MTTPLLQLQDGDLLEFTENHHSSRGCETCDYGSSYVQELTVRTTKGDTTFNFEQMYDYPVSHDFLFKTILPAVEQIKAMTIAEFLTWLENQCRHLLDPESFNPTSLEVIQSSPVEPKYSPRSMRKA